jgi:hypothetical protein
MSTDIAVTNGTHQNKTAALKEAVDRAKKDTAAKLAKVTKAVEDEAARKTAHLAATRVRTDAVAEWKAAEKAEQAAREAWIAATLDEVQ